MCESIRESKLTLGSDTFAGATQEYGVDQCEVWINQCMTGRFLSLTGRFIPALTCIELRRRAGREARVQRPRLSAEGGENPRAIPALVMKLRAKRVEDRYQTACGLERDLRRC